MKRPRASVVILGIVVLGTATIILWYFNQIRFVYTQAKPVQFEIAAGESTQTIITHLQNQKIIHNSLVTLIYSRMHSTTFLPGTYQIPTSYDIPLLLQQLSKAQRNEQKLTVPEGFTKEQIADLLPEFGLSDTTFLQLTKDAEGKLFPDTYNIDSHTTEADLVKRMTDQYTKKASGLTIGQNDLILASIVEREAKTTAERPLIAGIYKNRLKNGMALEADPTVQYAKYTALGLAPLKDGKRNYWAPITKDDYTGVKSAYNTYLHAGLPPAPICNPGLKSLDAALHATQTDAVYFFHTKDGQIITSRTLDEHNANKARYLK